MRFAIAAGVLAQTLPVTSKANDLVAILAGNLEKVEQTSIHSLLQRGNDAKPKLLNGIRRKNGRKHGVSWLNQRVHQNEALKNAPQDESAVVECDPKKSADVGVLSCGPGKFCKESESSSLGGVCNDSVFSSPRLLQGSNATNTTTSNGEGVEYYYNVLCNKSSPVFDDSYNCDCRDFNGATLAGNIVCQIYENECLVPFCNDTCASYSIIYTAEGPLDYGYSTCVELAYPDGEAIGCYGYSTKAGGNSTTCSASWNGANCNCTAAVPVDETCSATIDCPGDGPSGVCTKDFFDQFTALEECFDGACEICTVPGTTVDPNAILNLPGYGNVSCVALDFAASSGQFNKSDCPLVQMFAGPVCCGASSGEGCPICGSGEVTLPNAIIEIPSQPPRTCAEIEAGALVPGNVDPAQCTLLQGFVQEGCGCTMGNVTTKAPSAPAGNSTIVPAGNGTATMPPSAPSGNGTATMPPSAPAGNGTATMPPSAPAGNGTTTMPPSGPAGNGTTTMPPSAPAGNGTTTMPPSAPAGNGTTTKAPSAPAGNGTEGAPTLAPVASPVESPITDDGSSSGPWFTFSPTVAPTVAPTGEAGDLDSNLPADGALGFVNVKNYVSFVGLSMAMVLYFAF